MCPILVSNATESGRLFNYVFIIYIDNELEQNRLRFVLK
jgi:hypothetical protein